MIQYSLHDTSDFDENFLPASMRVARLEISMLVVTAMAPSNVYVPINCSQWSSIAFGLDIYTYLYIYILDTQHERI